MSDDSTDPKSIPEHRKMAIELFNHTWSLIDLKQRTPDQIDEMIRSAYASSYHWLRGGEPANQARGHWQISASMSWQSEANQPCITPLAASPFVRKLVSRIGTLLLATKP